MTHERGDGGEPAPDSERGEAAAIAAADPNEFLSVLPHFYRGEVTEAATALDRIDRTTDWGVALIAALLSIVFAGPEMPPFLLLIGLLALCVFLFFEVRRYRTYDLSRARVRLVQENLFANALDGDGPAHDDWRAELGEDLRSPTYKVSAFEALSRRVRRVYGLLFAVLGAAWVAKVTLFTPEAQWTEAAELPGVPGLAVGGALALFYVGVVAVALWPRDRQAMGEVRDAEPGDWKTEGEE